MSIKATYGSVTANNVTSLPIKNSSGTTIGTVTLQEVGTITEPTATKEITANGTVDVKNYASATVNVPSSCSHTFGEKTITTNGTYEASSDSKSGYNKVVVNVPQSSGGSSITGLQPVDLTYSVGTSLNASYGDLTVTLPDNGYYVGSCVAQEGNSAYSVPVVITIYKTGITTGTNLGCATILATDPNAEGTKILSYIIKSTVNNDKNNAYIASNGDAVLIGGSNANIKFIDSIRWFKVV